ncbi:mitochondrial calcium uniporter regulator 1 isoform X2 [Rhineura floridana]|uniref:mitochondrial calcium uniporter regulator 1 isoform X2 n=1 Tax=Rhineura floridana TaxID=261503 RepID=UPI002AC83472|nr:mitochondrial calcium uniporter regulator 1 isoform X2 [Rhineura floridana]
MVRGQAAAVVVAESGRKFFFIQREPDAAALLKDASRYGVLCSPVSRRCLGDWKRTGFFAQGVGGACGCSSSRPTARGSFSCSESACSVGTGTRFLSLNVGRCLASGARDVTFNASHPQLENSKGSFSPSGSRKLYFDTHAFVCLLENNGFTTQQSEIIVSALMNIISSNMNVMYKDMVTKVQQEIVLQQIMSHIGVVKKDMIILEKSEFSALRAENEKIKLELHQLRKQVMDEVSKVRTDSKLDFNLEKSRTKELYSLNERKLLKMRTEIVELVQYLHALQ